MERLICGRGVWAEVVRYHLHSTDEHPLDLAVGYVGSTGREILVPRGNARLIVNGSSAALKQGATDPAVLEAWLDSGASVRSLDFLHAKTLLVDADPPLAVVGSMNLSRNSDQNLHEAAIVTDSEEIAEALRDQFDIWWGAAATVDTNWLNRAKPLYRTPRPSATSAPEPPLIDPDAPMWVHTAGGTEWQPSPEALDAEASAVLEHGAANITTWGLHRSDAGRVTRGQTVILAEPSGERVRGNTPVNPPAVVLQVILDSHGNAEAAVLARDSKLPRQQVRVLRLVLGDDFDFDAEARITDTAHKAALLALWPNLNRRAPDPNMRDATSFDMRDFHIDLDALYEAMAAQARPTAEGLVFDGYARNTRAVKWLLADLFGVPARATYHPVNHAIRSECRDRLAELGWAHQVGNRSGKYILTR